MIDKIKDLPPSAGIYQYFNDKGQLLYIGKAKNLKNRVKSYWYFTPSLRPNPSLNPRIVKMLEETASINYIVVQNEHDALILENSLIKQLKPKYNILLRDDKTYPYIYIDYSKEYPRFEITRKIINAKDVKYFGPYSVGARDILDSVYELCMLVQKKGCLKGKKACLYYQIKKCLAPCEFDVKSERYRQETDKAVNYIENKKELIKKLQEKMSFYAEELRFEEASEIKNRIQNIQKSNIVSQIDLATNDNYDIFCISHKENRAIVVRIFMRNGKVVSSSHDFIYLNEGFDEDEIYYRAVMEYYGSEAPPIIAPVLVAHEFESKKLLQEYLSAVFNKKAQITNPKRGDKKRLTDLAMLNADELLNKTKNDTSYELALLVQELFKLQRTPLRIEVFDNSHMSGQATVGAMIVYESGIFDKKAYRTYHLDSKDEYSQMREMLTKRIESFEKNTPPDLWILDGGETLLKLAIDLLDSNGVFLDVIAVSKEKIDAKAHRAKGEAKDIIHTADTSFNLKPTDKRLQFVQRLRDEAHRSAVTFHKKTKLKLDQESKLLSLKGISEAKIKKLLSYFGTFEAIRAAGEDEIVSVLNEKDAKTIKLLYN
ncbi:excinuclease ABC subunit UvrC [Sulfurimonas sp. HSL-1716]|uniref:excinuclease ABC subunit UvrC n=1 Tax=Hydrocurvibacter sulfurireducens TaxID=3131937 RepID=UPI0031F8CE14